MIPSPCFVLEEKKLIKNLQLIQRVQNEANVSIILAFKGFAMWSAFPLVKKYASGATASSLNEARLCFEDMKTKAHTYCVAYRPDEFKEICDYSSHLTFNSLNQYRQFINEVPENISVGLRVNPEWSDVATGLYNPSSPTSRLGIISEKLTELPKRVEGLHFHVLCESDSYALEKLLTVFEEKFGHLIPKIKWLNMGGGHLMTRKDYDIEHLITILNDFKNKYPHLELMLEPGSAFAWQTGNLHTTILDIVSNGGTQTIIFDGSFTCHMPDCLEMPYRPEVENASPIKIENWEAYRLGGVSCLAGDFLDEYWFEKSPKIGDTLVFKDMIHYTMVKTNTFNGVHHPSIGILKDNGEFKLVKEFDYSDYKNRLS